MYSARIILTAVIDALPHPFYVMLPIYSSSKKLHDVKEYWNTLELYW